MSTHKYSISSRGKSDCSLLIKGRGRKATASEVWVDWFRFVRWCFQTLNIVIPYQLLGSLLLVSSSLSLQPYLCVWCLFVVLNDIYLGLEFRVWLRVHPLATTIHYSTFLWGGGGQRHLHEGTTINVFAFNSNHITTILYSTYSKNYHHLD